MSVTSSPLFSLSKTLPETFPFLTCKTPIYEYSSLRIHGSGSSFPVAANLLQIATSESYGSRRNRVFQVVVQVYSAASNVVGFSPYGCCGLTWIIRRVDVNLPPSVPGVFAASFMGRVRFRVQWSMERDPRSPRFCRLTRRLKMAFHSRSLLVAA